jgi:hypothetical protein
MVEGDAKLAPVGHLQREVVEVRIALGHQGDDVVVAVDVEPGPLVAEAVGQAHAQDVAVEGAHRLELAGERVDVAELARPEARQHGRLAGDGRARVGIGPVGQDLDALAVGVLEVEGAVAALVLDAARLERARGGVEVLAACQLEGGVVMAGLSLLPELERVALVAAGEIGTAPPPLALAEAELDRPARRCLVQVGDPEADVVDAAQLDHPRHPAAVTAARRPGERAPGQPGYNMPS